MRKLTPPEIECNWDNLDFYFLCNIQNVQWPAIYTDWKENPNPKMTPAQYETPSLLDMSNGRDQLTLSISNMPFVWHAC